MSLILDWTHSTKRQLYALLVVPPDVFGYLLDETLHRYALPAAIVAHLALQSAEEPLTRGVIGFIPKGGLEDPLFQASVWDGS